MSKQYAALCEQIKEMADKNQPIDFLNTVHDIDDINYNHVLYYMDDEKVYPEVCKRLKDDLLVSHMYNWEDIIIPHIHAFYIENADLQYIDYWDPNALDNLLENGTITEVRRIVLPEDTHKNLYSVICDDTYKQDYILIRATDIDKAWDIFWEKMGNVETGFGSKDMYNPIYERFDKNPKKLISRTYNRKNGCMNISFEKISGDSDYYIYLGGVTLRE